MPEWLSNLVQQARGLPAGRQLVLAATAAGSLAFFLWLALSASEAEYRLLYRGLGEDESAKVTDGLRGERIPYRLEEGGTAVFVPALQVHEARIRLAGKGLPAGGGAGFEIFDRPSFGVTEFVNRVNYRRALQGELARSIEQLEAVEKARVQIALPERTGFALGGGVRPTASVVVQLRGGRDLGADQVAGIEHLVGSAVEGLDPKSVTVIDHLGRLLSSQPGDAPAGNAPAGALAHQSRVEQELAHRIESILERTVGVGRVVARVHAEMDWTQSEKTEERFDPDGQVARSEQRTTEKSSDAKGGASGVPGVASNSPNQTAPGAGGTGGQRASSKSTKTINYEISKIVNREVAPVGSVKRLSVAVLVDGQPLAPGADPEKAEFTPWDDATLKQFEELARQAVGLKGDRGDEITVKSAPFRSVELESAGLMRPELIGVASSVLRYALVVIALLLFARLVVRPVLGAWSEAASRFPMTAGALERQLGGGVAGALGEGEGPSLAASVSQVARAHTDESVNALRGWLNQR